MLEFGATILLLAVAYVLVVISEQIKEFVDAAGEHQAAKALNLARLAGAIRYSDEAEGDE